MMKKINKVSDFLEKTFNFPVFIDNVQKDEIKKNKTLFLIEPIGSIRRTGNSQYSVEMYIYFITRAEDKIDEFELIKGIEDCGFIFSVSDIDFGKLRDTDNSAIMRTYTFSQAKRICR